VTTEMEERQRRRRGTIDNAVAKYHLVFKDDVHRKLFDCRYAEVHKETGRHPDDLMLYLLKVETGFLRAVLQDEAGGARGFMHDIEKVRLVAKARCNCTRARRGPKRAMVNAMCRAKVWLKERLSKTGDLAEAPNALAHYGLEGCVVLAEAFMWQALLQFKSGSISNFTVGAINLRRAWKLYEKLEARIQQDEAEGLPVDATLKASTLFGAGAFKFFVSLVPSGFTWIAQGLGFTPDREKGLQQLHTSMKCGVGRAAWSASLLLWINGLFYEDFDETKGLLASLQKGWAWGKAHAQAHEHLKLSPLLAFLAGYCLRVNGRVRDAREMFRGMREASGELEPLQVIGAYEEGWCVFLFNDWKEAAELFEWFLERHKSTTYRAWCAMQLAFCHHMLGNTDKCADLMRKVKPWQRPHYSYDQFAARKADEYLSGGFSEVESLCFQAYNLSRCRDFDNAQRLLDEAAAKVDAQQDSDMQAYVVFLRGKLIKLRNHTDADALEDLWERELLPLQSSVKRELYLFPFACYHLADAHFERYKACDYKEGWPHWQKSEQWLERAQKTFSSVEYDFKKPLSRKLSKLLDCSTKARRPD